MKKIVILILLSAISITAQKPLPQIAKVGEKITVSMLQPTFYVDITRASGTEYPVTLDKHEGTGAVKLTNITQSVAQMPGAPVTKRFEFKAIKPGTVTLTFANAILKPPTDWAGIMQPPAGAYKPLPGTITVEIEPIYIA